MEQLKVIRDTVQHIYWSLLLQGILFVALAVLILLYPVLLFALASVTFLLVGLTMLGLAWRVKLFWDKVPRILK